MFAVIRKGLFGLLLIIANLVISPLVVFWTLAYTIGIALFFGALLYEDFTTPENPLKTHNITMLRYDFDNLDQIFEEAVNQEWTEIELLSGLKAEYPIGLVQSTRDLIWVVEFQYQDMTGTGFNGEYYRLVWDRSHSPPALSSFSRGYLSW